MIFQIKIRIYYLFISLRYTTKYEICYQNFDTDLIDS